VRIEIDQKANLRRLSSSHPLVFISSQSSRALRLTSKWRRKREKEKRRKEEKVVLQTGREEKRREEGRGEGDVGYVKHRK